MADHRSEPTHRRNRIGSPDSPGGAWFLLIIGAIIIGGLVTWLGVSG
ncbi:MAG: hypothetical protein ABW022_08690 [Actinoplanes sp.]